MSQNHILNASNESAYDRANNPGITLSQIQPDLPFLSGIWHLTSKMRRFNNRSH